MSEGFVGICTRVYWELAFTNDETGVTTTYVQPAMVVRRYGAIRLSYPFAHLDLHAKITRRLCRVTPEHAENYRHTYGGITKRSICQRRDWRHHDRGDDP